MRKKLLIAIVLILSLVTLMFAEYRYIMHHIIPYQGNGTSEGCAVYLEIFGNIDTYYAEYIGNIED